MLYVRKHHGRVNADSIDVAWSDSYFVHAYVSFLVFVHFSSHNINSCASNLLTISPYYSNRILDLLLTSSVALLGWPNEAWDGKTTRANGGGGRGLPGPGSNGDGYYHYKRTTREIVPKNQGRMTTTTTY